MNMKKIAVLALSLCMVAAIAVTGTIAYFTDADNATNVFTVGDIDITLIEKERDEEGGLVTYNPSPKPLYPIVGSGDESGEKDDEQLPIAENYVDKVVTIKNEGSEKAWVRAYFGIPSALDDGYETFNASMNILHFNFGYKADGTSTIDNEWLWKKNGQWMYYETVIDGIAYNVYYADYYQPLEAGATTERLLNGVYLDKSFDVDDDGNYYAFGSQITLDEGWDWKNIELPVYAVAVQEAGFDSVEEAIVASFGEKYNPLGGTADADSWTQYN